MVAVDTAPRGSSACQRTSGVTPFCRKVYILQPRNRQRDEAVPRWQNLGDFSEPPKSIILALVPEVGIGGQMKSDEVAGIANGAEVVHPAEEFRCP